MSFIFLLQIVIFLFTLNASFDSFIRCVSAVIFRSIFLSLFHERLLMTFQWPSFPLSHTHILLLSLSPSVYLSRNPPLLKFRLTNLTPPNKLQLRLLTHSPARSVTHSSYLNEVLISYIEIMKCDIYLKFSLVFETLSLSVCV